MTAICQYHGCARDATFDVFAEGYVAAMLCCCASHLGIMLLVDTERIGSTLRWTVATRDQ